jgi:hypothetical protein
MTMTKCRLAPVNLWKEGKIKNEIKISFSFKEDSYTLNI